MNIVDSSAWLEYFAGTPRSEYFAKAIEATDQLLVSSIIIYEVFKKILLERDENTALALVAHLKMGKVVDIDTDIALSAAKLSVEKKLPMADSLILATAYRYDATLWTQDADFRDIQGVKYFDKH